MNLVLAWLGWLFLGLGSQNKSCCLLCVCKRDVLYVGGERNICIWGVKFVNMERMWC